MAYIIGHHKAPYLPGTLPSNAIVFDPVPRGGLSRLRRQITSLVGNGRLSRHVITLGLFYLHRIRTALSLRGGGWKLDRAMIVGLMLAHKSLYKILLACPT